MKKVIPINELTTDMYVTRIAKAEGNPKMKAPGKIRDIEGIKTLQRLKVIAVEVDLSKSSIDDDQKASTPAQQQDLTEVTATEAVTFDQEISRAQDLYASARNIQQKAFSKIKTNTPIDIQAYEEMAAEFFDSIMRNPDALLCMTKLQDKDAYLLEHSINVGILLAIFARHLGYTREICEKLTLAGLMHDVGKAEIPDEILFKAGKLTKEEFEVIKKHTSYGADILQKAGITGMSVDIALKHHERLSGSGYPNGLVGHQLNRYVRMSCIVDVYDAITAERVYKAGMTPLQAIKIIKKDAGTEFDANLVDKFIEAIGLFSIGTFVLMESGKLGIVAKSNFQNPLKPQIKLFYHSKHKHHIEPKNLDLSSKMANDTIDKPINPADFGIDANQIIDSLLLSS